MNLEQIDTSTTAGKARVMQLAAEGRRLAFKNKYQKVWAAHVCSDDCDWDWRSAEFAIIAELVGPDEVWALVHRGGSVLDIATDILLAGEDQYLVRYIRADLAGGDA
jgi:hypothetical protein